MTQLLSDHIAHYVTRTEVPELVLEAARLRLVDAIGLACAASSSPAVEVTEEAAPLAYGTGPGHVIGGRGISRLSCTGAAVVNATRIHALDFDDTYLAGTVHSHVSIIPAALAAADLVDADLGTVFRSTALAAEVTCWMSEQIGKDMQLNGFHTSAVVGAVAAAISAALTMKLDEAGIKNAIGLSAMVAAGLWQFEESWAKNWNVAQAASAGFSSAVLASKGFQGPVQPLEGTYGLLATHGKLSVDWVNKPLGGSWRSPLIAMKAYGACQFMQPIIDAALNAHNEIIPSQIKKVVVDVPDELGIRCVAVPVELRRYPQEAYRARFAGHWLVARALIDGDITLRTFDTITPIPQDLRHLVEKIEFRVTPFDIFPACWPSRLHVTDVHGKTSTFSVSGEPLSMDSQHREIVLKKCRQNLVYGGFDPTVADQLLELFSNSDAKIEDFWQRLES